MYPYNVINPKIYLSAQGSAKKINYNGLSPDFLYGVLFDPLCFNILNLITNGSKADTKPLKWFFQHSLNVNEYYQSLLMPVENKHSLNLYGIERIKVNKNKFNSLMSYYISPYTKAESWNSTCVTTRCFQIFQQLFQNDLMDISIAFLKKSIILLTNINFNLI